MQIMNLARLLKHIGWFLTSYNTLNNLADAVIKVNKDGIISSYNKRAKEVLGFVDGGFGKYNIDNIIKDADVISKSENLSQPILTRVTLSEREFYAEINSKPCFNGHCVVIRDLTALTKELKNEEKIRKFNNEKNAMLVKVEDDIKAPISSIAGFSQGLLDGLGGSLSEKQEKYVRIIHNNANDLEEFLSKLIGFSKVESSIYEENYKTFDIIELIKNQSKEFAQRLSQKEITLDIEDIKLKNRNVYTDINAIEKVYTNIMETALTMTEKGSISVSLSNPAEEICELLKITNPAEYLSMGIIDTGVGIPVDEMKYLCEPYAQLEKGKKNLMRAFRLGIASILTKRAGGFITIKSEVAKGTRYEIILPIEKR